MQLTQFASGYCAQRDLSKGTRVQIEFSVRALEKHLGRAICLSDLSDDLLNNWIDSRLADGVSRIHVNRQRCSILTLWKAAYPEHVAVYPRNVRVVKIRLQPPVAWWPTEFTAILNAIDNMPGCFMCGVPKRLFMRAFVLTAYYSGLRPSDVRALRCTDLQDNGKLVVVVQKTGQMHDCTLPQTALEAIAKTRPEGRDLLFPISSRSLCEVWQQISKLSKVPGTPKFLRRTGATRCEQEQPGSAKRYLGHQTDGLAYRHYIDSRQLKSDRPQPPPIA